MKKYILFVVLLLFPSLCFATTGQIRSVVMMAKAASGFTDDFERADANPIGSPWAIPTFAANPMQIVSGKATGISNLNENIAYYTGTFSADQYSEAFIGENEGNGAGYNLGVVVRCLTGSTKSYYVLVRTGTASIELWKLRNGAWSSLTSQTASFTGGAIMRLEVTGTSPAALVLKVGGSTITTINDSTDPLTSGNPGIYASAYGEYIDNWAGDNL